MASQPPVAIIMGSQSDWATMRHAAETLDALGTGSDMTRGTVIRQRALGQARRRAAERLTRVTEDLRQVLLEFKGKNPSGKDGFLPFVEDGTVCLEPVGLVDDGRVPVEAQGREIGQLPGIRTLDGSVEILHPDEEPVAGRPRHQPRQ